MTMLYLEHLKPYLTEAESELQRVAHAAAEAECTKTP